MLQTQRPEPSTAAGSSSRTWLDPTLIVDQNDSVPVGSGAPGDDRTRACRWPATKQMAVRCKHPGRARHLRPSALIASSSGSETGIAAPGAAGSGAPGGGGVAAWFACTIT